MIRIWILDLQEDTIETDGFSQKVLKYIEVVKDKTGLEIGFTFHSENIQAYYEKPKMSCKCPQNVHITYYWQSSKYIECRFYEITHPNEQSF